MSDRDLFEEARAVVEESRRLREEVTRRRSLPQLVPGPLADDIAEHIATRRQRDAAWARLMADPRIREQVEAIERERLLDAKTAPARAAQEAERRDRAEAHRFNALPGLADRLAGAVFDHIEAGCGRPVVRDQLADALCAVLMRSGLWRDPRSPPAPPRR